MSREAIREVSRGAGHEVGRGGGREVGREVGREGSAARSRRRPLPQPLATVLPVALAAALTGTAAACGAAGVSDRAGTLVVGVNTEPQILDPHASPQEVTALFTRPVLDSLVALDDQGRPHPWLAESWTVSGDRRTYTFRLRKDVRFSDGTPFDAAAVKANFDHIVDPRTRSRLAARQFGPYRGTTVTGPYTVEVRFSRPYSAIFSALGSPYFGMQSPASLRRGPEALARQVVGSGPFVIERFVPHRSITYRRNPAYRWGPGTARRTGPARLERLEFRILTEDSVRLGALTSGQLDAITGLAPVSVKQVRADRRFRLESRQAPGAPYAYYPNTTAGPFTDPRVRRAFRTGIDVATIIRKLYFGVYRPAAGPLTPATPGYDRTVEAMVRHDPAAAARLLDEAGWSGRDGEGYRTRGGRRLTVRWPFAREVAREQRVVLAEQIQAEGRKLGFDIRLVNVTNNQRIALYGRGDYDLADFSWQRPDGDTLRDLFATSSIPTPRLFGQNGARVSDPRIDTWLDAALGSSDPAERAAAYARVQRKAVSEALVFPLYVPSQVMAISQDVHDIGWDLQAYPTFYDAWVGRPL